MHHGITVPHFNVKMSKRNNCSVMMSRWGRIQLLEVSTLPEMLTQKKSSLTALTIVFIFLATW